MQKRMGQCKNYVALNPGSLFWILSCSFGEKSEAPRQNPEQRTWV